MNHPLGHQKMPSFSIALPCYNEEQNIGELLTLLSTGWDSGCQPSRIAVFSSECSDRTEEIVKAFAKTSPVPVHLKTEEKRGGKCHAINQLIDMIGSVEVIVLVSSDVQVSSDSLKRILSGFQQPNVGVVAGRPEPLSDQNNLAYRISKVMWDIHHHMVLQAPKSTEITAFRNLGFRLDESSLVDEAEIEWNVTQLGYSIRYCPQAVIRNRAPQTLMDYIRQRTRVMLGHFILKNRKRYRVGSMMPSVRVNALVAYLKTKKPDLAAYCLLIILETWIFCISNLMSKVKKQSDGRWARIASAKKKFS